ncbi:hypothetical protein [Celeribacter sp. SCSIO 80788]|uniref:hypothetical protein n=1 Tax=Celeribacter sp. SCSIO 80788 TaxID=3117013 RepID=UPI003DA4BBA2
MKRLIAPLLLTLLPATSVALSPLERMILEELTCERPPNSLAILRRLSDSGQITPDDNIGYDSLSCWKIVDGLTLAGMPFESLCVYEDSPSLQASSPEFYYRGPGTSPGQTLSLGSSESAEALSDWYLKIFGPRNVNTAISEGEETTLQSVSEVRCTDWMLPPPRD